MEDEKEYYAFISYKSEDAEWAIWLQHELEHYHLPASYNGHTDIRQDLRPVFRDIDELSAGNLPKQIQEALENSQNLIVVCSPQAAASPWVNLEVKTFIKLGRTDRIFPFIVEGNSPKEFFPPALRALPQNEERLGGDAFKQGRDIAFVKVVAGLLGVHFDSLWGRYEKEKAEEERRQREQRDKLLIAQGRFVAEKAYDFIEKGDSYIARKALLELYGNDDSNNPYVAEADKVIRRAVLENSTIIDLGRKYGRVSVSSISLSKDGSMFAIATHKESVLLYNSINGRNLNTISNIPCCAYTKIHFSEDNRLLIVTTMHSVRLYELDKCILLHEWNDDDTTYDNNIVNARFEEGDKKIVIASKNGRLAVINVEDFTIAKRFQFEIVLKNKDKGICYVRDSYEGGIMERHYADNCRLMDFVINHNTIIGAFSDGVLRVIQLSNGESKSKRINKKIHSVYLSRDNNLVVATSNTIRIYSPKTLRIKQVFNIESSSQQEYINNAYLEGKVLILSISSEKQLGSSIQFYFWKDGHFVFCPEWNIRDDGIITHVSIDEDVTKLLFLTDAGKIRLWSPQILRHKELCGFNRKIDNIYPLNKENEVAIETSDGIITIINPRNGSVKSVMNTSEDILFDKLNHLDLRHKKIKYNTDDFVLENAIFDRESAIITTTGYIIASGKNGKTLIIESGTLSITKELIYPDDYVDCRFNEISPDEKYIITASRDGYIYIWELSSAILMQTYFLPETITAISFSPDGTTILIGTENGRLVSLEWHSFESLIEEQKTVFNGAYLSPEEKIMFYL